MECKDCTPPPAQVRLFPERQTRWRSTITGFYCRAFNGAELCNEESECGKHLYDEIKPRNAEIRPMPTALRFLAGGINES